MYSNAYKQDDIDGFLSYNHFVCRRPLLLGPVPLKVPLPVMPCLAKLNNWLLLDKGNSWTGEELEAAMNPPEPSCLDIQVMPTLRPRPAKRPTINELHAKAKLINGNDNFFFVFFLKRMAPSWRRL